MTVRILLGNCLDRLGDLPADSVHCVVTSVPYWGLRSYGTEPQVWGGEPGCDHDWQDLRQPRRGRPHGKTSAMVNGGRDVVRAQALGKADVGGDTCARCGAWRGEHGQEPTLDAWLANEVAIFRAVRRVLRPDGTLWLNIGDAYAGDANGRSAADQKAAGTDDRTFRDKPFSTASNRIPAKNRLMLPARLALALQDDGWFLRDEIIWHKQNPMPSSVKDRTTPAHEMVYLLTKRARYYYDYVAIMEAASGAASGNGFVRPERQSFTNADGTARGNEEKWAPALQRAKRSVWSLTNEPFPEAHFATFPPKLIEPMILAGTSHRGVCPDCGKPWERQVDKVRMKAGGSGKAGNAIAGKPTDHLRGQVREGHDVREGPVTVVETIGWVQSCKCPAHEPVPATVLDPFGGSGTTGLVAEKLRRDSVLIELNPAYAEIADRRIRTELGRVDGDVAVKPAADLPLFMEAAE